MSAVADSFETLEPAIDPNNRITFLLDWELTMKCNLDCSYCPTGIQGNHDNSTQHPPFDDCIKALEFMFEYADLYMHTKPKGIRYVILNVYGGEALHHPDIVEILSQVKKLHEPYQSRWHLTVTTTTNAAISKKKLEKIIPYIDEFTVSYHSEAHLTNNKYESQFKENLLIIANSGKRQKCVVLMHQIPERFEDCNRMIDWLNENNIKLLPRGLDDDVGVGDNRMYNQQQVKWFKNLYQEKTFQTEVNLLDSDTELHMTNVGRACCGGRQMCGNQNFKERHYYVENKFPDWYCSVNHFFVFVKQINGEVYVNKDCKMSFDGTVGPIGNLNNTDKILSTLRTQLGTGTMPVIQCKKYKCACGLCAPKAKNFDDYKTIMKKYQKEYKL